jgi:gliding motility-associated protein GldC
MREKEVKIKLSLDDNDIPSKMWWSSTDDKKDSAPEMKAMFLSMFDKDTKDTLKLDLWTKDFQMNEMDRFIYHTIRSLADSYLKATNNKDLANDMQRFAEYFGEKTEILAKDDKK